MFPKRTHVKNGNATMGATVTYAPVKASSELYTCLTCEWDLCADCLERGEHAVRQAFARVGRPSAGGAFAGMREGCDGHLANHVPTALENTERSLALLNEQMMETRIPCYKAQMIPYSSHW